MTLRTRQFVCRTLFLGLGLLPLLAALGWAGWVRVARSGNYFETAISQFLEHTVTVGNVQGTRPGTRRLHDVRLLDRETNTLMAQASQATISKELFSLEPDHTLVNLQDATIVRSRLADLVAAAYSNLLRTTVHQETVHLRCGSMELSQATKPIGLDHITVTIQSTESGRELRAEFIPAETPTSERPAKPPTKLVHFHITRDQTSPTPTTRIELHTGDTPLPCHLIADWLPSLARLGRDVTFCGYVWVDQTERGWKGELTGKIHGVNLAMAIGDRFGFQVDGTATVTVRRATIAHSRLATLDATFHVSDGVIDARLVNSLVHNLGWELVGAKAGQTAYPFDQMAAVVSMSRDGLRVAGGFADDTSGIAQRKGVTFLRQTKVHDVPITALVGALAPDEQVPVPINTASESLLRVLPLR